MKKNLNARFASFAEAVIRFRIPVLILFIILAAISVSGILKLRVTVSIDSFFLPDDPLVAQRDRYESIFSNNDFIGLLIEADDVFEPEIIQLIHDLGNRIEEEVPYVSSITSIPATSPALLGGKSFHFENGLLTDKREDIEKLRERFDRRRSLRSVLYSKDYSQAWLLVRLEEYPEVWESSEEPPMYAGGKMMDVVGEFQGGDYRIYPTGIPVMAFRKSNEMMEDLGRILLIAGIAALICILVLIRTPMGVAGSLLVMAGSLAAVFGSLGRLGITADTTFMLVPMLLTIAVTVGYTIHVTNFFKREFRRTGKRREAVIYAFSETGWPVLFTAFTTIVSLMSFMFVAIYPIRWVGAVSSASILFVYLFIMLFFCALLSFGPDREPEPESENSGGDEVFERIGMFFVDRGRIFIPLSAILLIICVYGAGLLEVNLNTNRMMGTKLPHSRDQIYISGTEIGVIMSYDIALLFSGKDQALTLDTLNRLDALAEFIGESGLIKGTRGISESLKEFNLIRFGDTQGQYRLPPTDAGLRGLVNLYSRIEGNDLSAWLNDDRTALRLTVQVNELSSSELKTHVDEVKTELVRLFPEEDYPGIEILVTGGVIQTAAMNQYVTRGLVISLGTALAAIALILMTAFRSVKLGLIAMIPNIAPVVAAGGLMGFCGIQLEFVTMTIAPMLLGLAVDDTIHLVTHLKTVFTRTGSYDTALSQTFRAVGKSIIQTTFILSVTFFIFVFSRVQSMVNMGIFTMIGIISALAADIIITPVLIKWTRPFGSALPPKEKK